MKIHVLGSGSAGNAIVIESDRQRILVDAGFGVRELARRLKLADVAPASISALIVTHEHGDHSHGVRSAIRRWHWPVYATSGTLSRMRTDPAEEDGAPHDWTLDAPAPAARERRMAVGKRDTHVVAAGSSLALDDLVVEFVKAPHDAREHVALVITLQSSGERVGIAYDIGHVSDRLIGRFAHLDALLIESNYDAAMLRTGPYPWSVKQRVSGPLGHLSNPEAGLMSQACVHRGLRHVVLCHLSETNNRPNLAMRAMKSALRGTAFRGTLTVAGQDRVDTLGGAVQMELAI